VRLIADFNLQKYEEAKGLKGLAQEACDNVRIDHHQSEDTGSGSMGFPFFWCVKERTALGAMILGNLQAEQKGYYFFS
jgi:hypothetical protein